MIGTILFKNKDSNNPLHNFLVLDNYDLLKDDSVMEMLVD